MAAISDSEAILNIYAPYVRDTTISFETDVPDVIEISRRIAEITAQYPYLVYQIDGEIVGYAYASKHRPRDAYKYDVDVSIYVLEQYHGSGIAYKLYDCLFALLIKLGYDNAYAGITVPNDISRRFHEKFGFTLIGTHHKTGYKFGKWHDVVWLEKTINEHSDNPEPVKLISDLPNEQLEDILWSAVL